MLRKGAWFLGVGFIGLMVDAVVFFMLTGLFDTHFAVARLVTSLIAVTVTWVLNRALAFRDGRLADLGVEYVRYLGASSLGALTNLAVSYPISLFDGAYGHVPAYGVGALAGLVVNFLMYDNYVFSGSSGSGKGRSGTG